MFIDGKARLQFELDDLLKKQKKRSHPKSLFTTSNNFNLKRFGHRVFIALTTDITEGLFSVEQYFEINWVIN